MDEIGYIILNCSASITNMGINDQMLALSKKHFDEQTKVMQSILSSLQRIEEKLDNGT